MIAATMFSGIGAPEEAMPEWDWRWHAEIEKFPCAVMAQRHPQSINLGDVNGKDFIERAIAAGRPDVLAFGSPCQSFSVAGRRLGLDDPRGNLALVALGIVARLKPRWFCFENVPGLLSSAEGSDFGLFLRTVDELGYCGAWTVLDAQHFGVAQRRERLFFVGHAGDWRGPAAVLFESESLCGHNPPSREAGQRPAPTLESRADAGGAGWGTDFLAGGGMAVAGAVSSKWSKGTGGPAGDECYNLVAFDERKITAPNDGSTLSDRSPSVDQRPPVAVAFTCKDHGADSSADVAPTLRAMPHDKTWANGGGQVAVAFKPSRFTRGKDCAPSEAMAPLSADADKGDQDPVLLQGTAVRRLTPRECERLQGYRDDYTLVTFRGKPAADGPRYRALGNSMAVPVIGWILRRIEAVDKILKACDNPEQRRAVASSSVAPAPL